MWVATTARPTRTGGDPRGRCSRAVPAGGRTPSTRSSPPTILQALPAAAAHFAGCHPIDAHRPRRAVRNAGRKALLSVSPISGRCLLAEANGRTASSSPSTATAQLACGSRWRSKSRAALVKYARPSALFYFRRYARRGLPQPSKGDAAGRGHRRGRTGPAWPSPRHRGRGRAFTAAFRRDPLRPTPRSRGYAGVIGTPISPRTAPP